MIHLHLLKHSLRAFGGLVLGGILSGCAVISAFDEAATPLDVFELRAPPGIKATSQQVLARDVIVELPRTSGALATDRIMIRPNTLQAQYLPDVRWSEPTPVMVQTLMLRTLEATGAVRYVGREPLGVSGDYAVLTEVVDFQAELAEDTDSATVRLSLIVKVVREADARIIANRTFAANAVAASTETLIVIQAFDVASVQLFSEFADWLPSALAGR
ncbi:ABC-type transport auxiliary lipoprotein family protein [Marinovum sp.]|uniref:ABC-type transport auxiliary lipoprotein family protein n=1 Tax=Marinovum sp. TaxID=2024839 RepID=UPI002B277B03|nr:ABC-type transport auxiliary lipoprotein family protein [Marinovum sp.]